MGSLDALLQSLVFLMVSVLHPQRMHESDIIARVLVFYGLDHIFLALSILWSPREMTPAAFREDLLRLVSDVLQLVVSCQ